RPCLWCVGRGSAYLAEQLPCFVLLLIVTFGDHFIEDVARAFGIAHVDVGAGQIELGGVFVGFAQKVEIVVIAQARIVGQGRRRRGRCLHRRAGGRFVHGQGIVQRQLVAQIVLVQGQGQGIVFRG